MLYKQDAGKVQHTYCRWKFHTGTIGTLKFTLKNNIKEDSTEKLPGGHLYFRLDIILVKGLSKHTLNTYFSGMKRAPKYACLHAFFIICPHVFSTICQYDQKHLFFKILHVFAPLNDVRMYIARSWKATLITWFFFLSNFKYKCPPGKLQWNLCYLGMRKTVNFPHFYPN